MTFLLKNAFKSECLKQSVFLLKNDFMVRKHHFFKNGPFLKRKGLTKERGRFPNQASPF
jgi:hypothetical protein